MEFILTPGELTLKDIRLLMHTNTTLRLNPNCFSSIESSVNVITHQLASGHPIYGINTGFGALANTQIAVKDLADLQRRIVLSHAAGTGPLFSDDIVRLILLLKINSLARGYSGVHRSTIEALIHLFNAQVYPCIPSQGSVGASGDLAPLAHLSALLLGIGEAHHHGKRIAADEALSIAELSPLTLQPKEGLALLNGTQVSTALAIIAYLKTKTVLMTAVAAGALSVEAARASHIPFDARIQDLRGQPGQKRIAAMYRSLLGKSHIHDSHQTCPKVQDPYSLRCQPQVMGACLTQLDYAGGIFAIEANAVSDNPLIFAEGQAILSGGNFHAEPIAMAADALAVSIAEMGALSERRIALLIDPHFSRLPPFLVDQSGINSGFMLAQVTAAALASENKSLAHPASIDSLPTSANQEDHVSMATFAARRLMPMVENTAAIIAIELLAAAQGIDFLRPLTTTPILEALHTLIREKVFFYKEDRFFAPDIEAIKQLVLSEQIHQQLTLDALLID